MTTKTYHLNPFSGEPNICRATVKPCPWGTPEEHFASLALARKAYEDSHAAETFQALSEEREIVPAPVDPPAPKLDIKARWLTPDKIAKINLDGISCRDCGRQPDPYQAAHIMDEQHQYRCTCGHTVDVYSMNVSVGITKSTHPALEKAGVYDLTWVHSSTDENWDQHLPKGFYAHVGSEQAAIDRQITETFNIREPEREVWLYDIKVDPSATILDEVVPDTNEFYSKSKPLQADVQRYVNRWEDLASVSLAVDTTKLQIIGRRKLSARQAWQTASVLNVNEFGGRPA